MNHQHRGNQYHGIKTRVKAVGDAVVEVTTKVKDVLAEVKVESDKALAENVKKAKKSAKESLDYLERQVDEVKVGGKL